MAAVIDDDEVAARQQGQREDECNKQLVVYCVRGKQGLNDMTSGGNRQCKASGWKTTWQEGVVDEARQAGGRQHRAIWWQAMQGNMAVDDKR
jgi:hypothetical protein